MTIHDFAAARRRYTGQEMPGPKFRPGDQVAHKLHPEGPYMTVTVVRPDERHRYRVIGMIGGTSMSYAEDDLVRYEPPGAA